MKIVKKIFYTIFGLLMATTLALIGVILYAEFTGHRFSMDKHTSLGDSSDEESRLAYDENGNLAELPGSADVPSEQAAAGQIPPDSSANISSADPSAVPPDSQAIASAESANPDAGQAGMDVSAGNSEAAPNPADSAVAANAPTGEEATPSGGGDTSGSSPANPEDETERSYIMDTGSGLFHTDTCTDAAAIAVDRRTERTTTRTKILDAGYQPCPSCNP